jgi:hypothetical protein
VCAYRQTSASDERAGTQVAVNKFEDLSIQAIVGDLEAIGDLKELLIKWTQVHYRRTHSCFCGCMCPLRYADTGGR